MPPVPSLMQRGRRSLSFSVRGVPPLTEAGFTGSRNVLIHWAQESFDQASLVREFVKWDYELRNFAQLETVVDRALAIATSEPGGPVYLTLPREVLAEPQARNWPSALCQDNRHTKQMFPTPLK